MQANVVFKRTNSAEVPLILILAQRNELGRLCKHVSTKSINDGPKPSIYVFVIIEVHYAGNLLSPHAVFKTKQNQQLIFRI